MLAMGSWGRGSVKLAARAVACILCCTLVLQACATPGTRGPTPAQKFVQGQQELAKGRVEEGLALIEQAAREDPRRLEYQVYLTNQREAISAVLAREADRYRAAGDYATAEAIYRQIQRLDPDSPRPRTGLAQIPVDQRHDLLIAEAEAAVAKGDNAAADGLMRPRSMRQMVARRELSRSRAPLANTGSRPAVTYISLATV